MRKILSLMRKLIEQENLIENGDKIAVGVSGGKDSLTLLCALREYQKHINPNFQLVAVAVDLSNGKMDYDQIKDFCDSIQVPFHLEKSNVFEILFEIRKQKNPCSLCANMRRGILNTAAKKLGCNVVALGHHADDFVETFLLSLFFEGRLYAMQPKTHLSRTNLKVIRPLLLVDESLIKTASKNLPVLKNICPQDHFSQRENAKIILEKFTKIYPDCKAKILAALTHPKRNKLWN